MRLHRGDIVRVIETGERGTVIRCDAYKNYPVTYSYNVRISGKYRRCSRDELELIRSYEDQISNRIADIIHSNVGVTENSHQDADLAAKEILVRLRELRLISKRQLEEI